MKTNTVIVIKPGSKWTRKGLRGVLTVIGVDRRNGTVLTDRASAKAVPLRLFGRADGYLPAVIKTAPRAA